MDDRRPIAEQRRSTVNQWLNDFSFNQSTTTTTTTMTSHFRFFRIFFFFWILCISTWHWPGPGLAQSHSSADSRNMQIFYSNYLYQLFRRTALFSFSVCQCVRVCKCVEMWKCRLVRLTIEYWRGNPAIEALLAVVELNFGEIVGGKRGETATNPAAQPQNNNKAERT